MSSRAMVLLVGPKGAGKTRIARTLADVFGAHCVPVEALWMARAARRSAALGSDDEREGFDEVADRGLAALAEHTLVVLDTTGASPHTGHFVARLSRADATLVVVRVTASATRCAARVAGRDATQHLPVDPARLAEIHERSERAPITTHATYDNDGAWDELGVRAFLHDALATRGIVVRARVPTLTSARLTLRDWTDDDLAPFAALNADPRVMEHFPRPLDHAESDALAARIRAELGRRGTGLFAVEPHTGARFVGFVGLSVPTFDAPFLPAVEIGWRLAAHAWGAGLATEAASVVLAHARTLGLRELVSFTSPRNERSRRVMERLGMARDPRDDFEHPRVPVGDPLRPHVLYRLRLTPKESSAC